MIRLDKYLADCALGTRSEVKNYIKKKQIQVNQDIANRADMKIDIENDVVCFNGKQLHYELFLYYVFHKPAGCVTATKDNLHKTVMDYFPETIKNRCFPVGRLDIDTEGLLLITNDGELSHHLLSPKHNISKKYYVRTDKNIPESIEEKFELGVDIGDDKLTLPAQWEKTTEDTGYLTITEGRFHQVKRMFHAVGLEVIYLKRVSMGNLELENLPLGEYRKLEKHEIEAMKK